MKYPKLPCGCEGLRDCPEAVHLWNEGNEARKRGDKHEFYRLRAEWVNHKAGKEQKG